MFLRNGLYTLLLYLHDVTKSYYFFRSKYDYFYPIFDHFNKENIAVMKARKLRIM